MQVDIKNILLNTNLFSIFIFILIVSANFLAEVFPCRLQYALRNNMVLKHIFGFFTMIFFVALSTNSNKDILIIMQNSFFLYILFILISRTHIYSFYFILLFLAIAYIINLMKQNNENDKKDSNEKDSNEKQSKEEQNYILDNSDDITYFLYIGVLIVIFIGVLLYMGEKKIEYKNNFNYFTFFIGKAHCKEESPKINFINAMKAHLKY